MRFVCTSALKRQLVHYYGGADLYPYWAAAQCSDRRPLRSVLSIYTGYLATPTMGLRAGAVKIF